MRRSRVLTDRLRSVLGFICEFKSQHDGIAPTIREIQSGMRLSSTSAVVYHLDRLEHLGYIVRGGPESGNRFIQVVGGRWLPPALLEPARELSRHE